MSENYENQKEHACQVCGQFDATVIGDGKYCPECYSDLGSSCAGGGVEVFKTPELELLLEEGLENLEQVKTTDELRRPSVI